MDSLISISYKDIIKLFDDDWDFSYLTYSEMKEVLNFPIKISANHLEHIIQKPDLPESSSFIIVVKQTQDYDYSLGDEFIDTCKKHFPEIIINNFWCNYKYAAVKSGLGQYAKNSLFYHPIFQFETHLYVAVIFNPLIDLPIRNPSNFNYLAQCNGCQDCANKCPVKAIHNTEGFPWIDMEKCDNFCMFGNHDYIPSVKQNFILLNHLSAEEKKNISSYAIFNELYPDMYISSGIITKDGQRIWYQYPTCRECTSQPKCSKYGGKYPYDSQTVKIKYLA